MADVVSINEKQELADAHQNLRVAMAQLMAALKMLYEIVPVPGTIKNLTLDEARAKHQIFTSISAFIIVKRLDYQDAVTGDED